jgi:capsular exopolysaccharide synthesis family protein
MAQYDVDLRDYWRIIKRRKTILFLMIVIVGLSSYAFAKLKEPKPLFQASSAVKIEQSAGLYNMLPGGFWFPTESMDTHAYTITSFPVLVMAAKDLGWIDEGLSEADIHASQTAPAQLQRLKAMSVCTVQAGTNIIDIQVTADEPVKAARVANALASAYRRFNIMEKNRRTRETKKFIEEQLQVTSVHLQTAEQKLRDFKENKGLVAIDEQTRNNLDRLYSVEEQHAGVEAAREDLNRKLSLLDRLRTAPVEEIAGSMFTVPENSPIFSMRNRLGELFLERQNLLIHLTEKHPRVNEVDERIRALVEEMYGELQSQRRTLADLSGALSGRLQELERENRQLPEKALELTRLQRDLALQETLHSQLKTKYQETLIQESGQVEEVTIVRPAGIPSVPFNIPSKLMIVITGIVLGLIIGVVLAFGAEVFDTSMGTIEDVEESLQVPVLGVIPFLGREATGSSERQFTGKERARDLITHYDPKSLAAEAFRSLRTNLQFMGLEIRGKTFLITSSFVKEGKSLNVINLALSVAQSGDKVLLVECDLRKPVIYKTFGLPRDPGLSDYVLGNYEMPEIINNISDVMLGDFEIEEILRTPGLDNLNIVTAGTRPPNPTEILSSERFRQFLKEVTPLYDYVFIDAPPILPVADATEIAPVVDGVILVYTVGKIGRNVLKRAKASLENIDVKVLGVILNNVKPEIGPDYFKYHTQHYYGNEPAAATVSDRPSSFFQKLAAKIGAGGKGPWLVFVAAVGLLTLGIFWQHLF